MQLKNIITTKSLMSTKATWDTRGNKNKVKMELPDNFKQNENINIKSIWN